METTLPRYPVAHFADWLRQAGFVLPASAQTLMFGDSPELALELAELVARGLKRATAGLRWSWEHDGDALPEPGQLYVVHDWDGRPHALVSCTSAPIVPYEQVDLPFALEEGEGFRSLADWRAAHWPYFARECQRLGRALDEQVPVVCLRFRRLHPAESTSG
jgi:uncharacterized protein YhfF